VQGRGSAGEALLADARALQDAGVFALDGRYAGPRYLRPGSSQDLHLRGDDRLSRLWREALGTDPGRPETGFLDAGGHSLTAARLAGLVLREYGVRLPLRRLLLDNMSQNDLRSWLSTATQRDAIAPHRAAARQETPRRDTVSSRQRGLWLWSQIFPGCRRTTSRLCSSSIAGSTSRASRMR
jgi:hypothetical protein